MQTLLLVFEFLGTTELLVIAVVALILFGPRKLPEIGRKVGRGLAEFKRASDDFKRTWEYEVELEQRKPALETPAGAQAGAALAGVADDTSPQAAPSGGDFFDGEQTIARGSAGGDEPGGGTGDPVEAGEWEPNAGRSDATFLPRPRAEEDEINAS